MIVRQSPLNLTLPGTMRARGERGKHANERGELKLNDQFSYILCAQQVSRLKLIMLAMTCVCQFICIHEYAKQNNYHTRVQKSAKTSHNSTINIFRKTPTETYTYVTSFNAINTFLWVRWSYSVRRQILQNLPYELVCKILARVWNTQFDVKFCLNFLAQNPALRFPVLWLADRSVTSIFI